MRKRSALTFGALPRFTNCGLREREKRKESQETMNSVTRKYRSSRRRRRGAVISLRDIKKKKKKQSLPCFECSLPIFYASSWS